MPKRSLCRACQTSQTIARSCATTANRGSPLLSRSRNELIPCLACNTYRRFAQLSAPPEPVSVRWISHQKKRRIYTTRLPYTA
ncbi:hypothetical protein [Lysobacter gummosus]|uniref:hypothetical protein n=1 Tax=Lysobacter gummosus TaxID=262324 RepID=UPI0036252AF9